MKASSGYCKVYYSLLFICYLEVVLWTSCLCVTALSPGIAVSHNYLLRETCNLKYAGKDEVHLPELPAAYLPLVDLHLKEEFQHLQDLNEAVGFTNPDLLQVGQSPQQVVLQELQGIPAPYAGIKALS